MEIISFFFIFIVSFVASFIDSTYKMGYGILMPIFLIIGYGIEQIIPMLLLVQLLSGFSKILYQQIYAGREYKSADDVSMRLTSWYLISGIIGVIAGITFFLLLSAVVLIIYIAFMLMVVGVISMINLRIRFSKERLAIVSAIGSFNQTIAGVGYGPLMSYKEFLHRGESKKIKIITTFSESMISGLGFLLYYAFFGSIIFADLQFIITVLVAGIMATPIGSLIMEHIDPKKGKKFVALSYISLGAILLILLLLNYF
ncbi:MAG: TSUP family transporter [Promethearchaeia archaeon]